MSVEDNSDMFEMLEKARLSHNGWDWIGQLTVNSVEKKPSVFDKLDPPVRPSATDIQGNPLEWIKDVTDDIRIWHAERLPVMPAITKRIRTWRTNRAVVNEATTYIGDVYFQTIDEVFGPLTDSASELQQTTDRVLSEHALYHVSDYMPPLEQTPDQWQPQPMPAVEHIPRQRLF